MCNAANFTEIDECAEDTDRCSQVCSNTVGSYLCDCRTGYTLASDGATCNGEVISDLIVNASLNILYRYQ